MYTLLRSIKIYRLHSGLKFFLLLCWLLGTHPACHIIHTCLTFCVCMGAGRLSIYSRLALNSLSSHSSLLVLGSQMCTTMPSFKICLSITFSGTFLMTCQLLRVLVSLYRLSVPGILVSEGREVLFWQFPWATALHGSLLWSCRSVYVIPLVSLKLRAESFLLLQKHGGLIKENKDFILSQQVSGKSVCTIWHCVRMLDFKNCSLSGWLQFQKKMLKWILAQNENRVSKYFWNRLKYTSAMLYYVFIQSHILNAGVYKIKILINHKNGKNVHPVASDIWAIFNFYVKMSKHNHSIHM